MINYIEKGLQLHREIARQGYSLSNLDGEWVSSNDLEVQAIIDSFVPIPDPAWDNFNLAMMGDADFNQVYLRVLNSAPIVANALPTALDQVTTKGTSLFNLIWTQMMAIGGATREQKDKWVGFAQLNHLPQEFIDILNQ